MLKMKINPTITTKITLSFGSVFAVAIMVASIFLFASAYGYYSNISREELNNVADRTAELIRSGEEISEQALKNLLPNDNISIRVTNMNTRREYMSTAQENFGPPPPDNFEEVRERFKDDKYVRFSFSLANIFGKNRFSYFERIAETREDAFFIQVSRTAGSGYNVLKWFSLAFAAFNIVGIIIAFLLGKYIAKKMLRPIIQVTNAAERISIEDLSQRIEVTGPDDEIKQLIVTFNDMIDRLDTSFKQQNQFISDASHELRTPISVIQGYANLMDRWGKTDPAVLQESIDSIKSETQHMSTLIKKLLFLAKGDQNKNKLQKEELSLGSIARDIMREYEVMAENNETAPEIILQEESKGLILGDYDMLKQMLHIFLENSIKYCGNRPVKIIIRIFEEEDRVMLSVSDQGIGINEEDIPHIFERFYRGDKSRSKEISGTGLGLSIARWIISRHGAKVNVKSREGEGTAFTVAFKKINEGS